jgi:hypothetical protein
MISIILTPSPNKMLLLDKIIVINILLTTGTEVTGGTSSNFTHDILAQRKLVTKQEIILDTHRTCQFPWPHWSYATYTLKSQVQIPLRK